MSKAVTLKTIALAVALAAISLPAGRRATTYQQAQLKAPATAPAISAIIQRCGLDLWGGTSGASAMSTGSVVSGSSAVTSTTGHGKRKRGGPQPVGATRRN